MKRAIFLILAIVTTAGPFGLIQGASAAVPNDPDYGKQWYLEAAHLPMAWDFAKGSPTVTVAVIDSGVDINHPDLKGRIWTNPGEIPNNGIDDDQDGLIDDVHGWNFVDNNNDPNPDLSVGGSDEGVQHGTLVAGVIAANGNNGTGVSGVVWNVRIMPLRVLDNRGSGGTSGVDAAIRYAVSHGAKVVNISFSGHSYSPTLANTLRDAYKAGVIIVAAAGNEGDTEQGGNLNVHPEYPVCYRGAANEQIVIGVSALDVRGKRSSFTNYGSECISLSAPGENFYLPQVYRPSSAGFQQAYGSGWSGSSLAAPLVSGVAALMASMSPGISPSEVRRLLMSTAENISAQNPGVAADLGAGELNAGAAIQALQSSLLVTGAVSSSQTSVPTSFITGNKTASDLVAATPGSGTTRVTLLKSDLGGYSGFDAYTRRTNAPPSIAFADVNGTGEPSVVVGAPIGEQPYVRIFNRDGALVSQFLAFPLGFRGGVNVTRADIDGSGKDAIAVAPASVGAPVVKLFNADGIQRGIFAAGKPKARTGLRLAAIDTDGNGIDEIAVAPIDATSNVVHVYDVSGSERYFFAPFARSFWRGGFEISAGDLNGDGKDELVVGAGVGGPPTVAIFGRDGRPLNSWTAYAGSFRGGVSVSVGMVHGTVGVLTGQVSGGGEMRAFDINGTLLRTVTPFGARFKGGLRPAADGLHRSRK